MVRCADRCKDVAGGARLLLCASCVSMKAWVWIRLVGGGAAGGPRPRGRWGGWYQAALSWLAPWGRPDFRARKFFSETEICGVGAWAENGYLARYLTSHTQSERGPLRYAREVTISVENDLSGAKIAQIPPFHCPLLRKRTTRSDFDRRAGEPRKESQLGVTMLSRKFLQREVVVF